MSSQHWKEVRKVVSLYFPEPFKPFANGNYGYLLPNGQALNIDSVRALERRGQIEVEGEWRTRGFNIRLTEEGVRAAVAEQDSGIIEFLIECLHDVVDQRRAPA